MPRAGERGAVEDGGDEIFDCGKVDVGMGGEVFFGAGVAEVGAAEGGDVDLAVGADDPELVAGDVRVPTDVDDGAGAAFVVDEDAGGVFDEEVMDGV